MKFLLHSLSLLPAPRWRDGFPFLETGAPSLTLVAQDLASAHGTRAFPPRMAVPTPGNLGFVGGSPVCSYRNDTSFFASVGSHAPSDGLRRGIGASVVPVRVGTPESQPWPKRHRHAVLVPSLHTYQPLLTLQ